MMKLSPIWLLFIHIPSFSMEKPLTKIQKALINQDYIIDIPYVDMAYVYNYPMTKILYRYARDYNISYEDAEKVEISFKTFMITAANSIHSERLRKKKICDLWHVFILHTKDYYTFCFKCFGRIIHHEPSVLDNLNTEPLSPDKSPTSNVRMLFTSKDGDNPY